MVKQLRKLLKDLFDFSEREVNGFLILLVLLAVYLIVSFNWKSLRISSEHEISSSEQAKLDSLLVVMQKVTVEKEEKFTKYKGQNYRPVAKKKRERFHPAKKLFPFDPNTVSLEEWGTLGVPRYIAERIDRYRQKAEFRYKDDLAKIYDFDAEKYQELAPYIELPERRTYNKQTAKDEKAPDKERMFLPAQELFEFDPNTITADEWAKLGVPNFIAQRIGNFISKGGNFQKPEDLSKIYDFDSQKYEELKPYIRIKSTKTRKEYAKPKQEHIKLKPFDLNTADTTTLKQIRGIGSGYAKRIVEMRERLGGFYSVTQVKELYRFPPETYERLATFAFVEDAPSLRKININTADVETLKTHFYIREQQARTIINYREQHGAFSKSDDLKKIYALKPAFIKKIAPYLAF